ncbi:MAG: hypothetical protein KGI54_05885 [Pseudomonadota bacterium]|nr:hypothetical protein [Pseudomonadota bacterium]
MLTYTETRLIVVGKLVKLGWSPCCNHVAAIARKSFQTVSGKQEAHAYLSKGDNFNRALKGTYYWGAVCNLLEPHGILIPLDTDSKACAARVTQFALTVDAVVSDSYGVRLRTVS